MFLYIHIICGSCVRADLGRCSDVPHLFLFGGMGEHSRNINIWYIDLWLIVSRTEKAMQLAKWKKGWISRVQKDPKAMLYSTKNIVVQDCHIRTKTQIRPISRCFWTYTWKSELYCWLYHIQTIASLARVFFLCP